MLALALGATAAQARASTAVDNPSLAYIEARAAAMTGDYARSAELLAALAQSQPQDAELARKALVEAMSAGNMPLALRLARTVPAEKLPSEARLLVAVEEIRMRRAERALPWLAVKGGPLNILDRIRFSIL